jgi:CRP-like cAMP-binding protein
MDGLPRTANAIALDDSALLVIQRSDFLLFLEKEPRLAIHLLKLMCERLRWTSELVEESAFMDGPARLAKRLLILASLHGRAARVGHLELRISQAELARFLGISRQIVNQHLADWRRHGWIELGRTQIVIRNTDALRAMIAEGARV